MTTIVVLSGLLAIILIVTTTPTLGLEAAAWSLVAVELATVAGLLVAVRRPVRALSP